MSGSAGRQIEGEVQECTRCMLDAGYHSGMSGAARCRLIELRARDLWPAEWLARADGRTQCRAFVDAEAE